MLNSCRYKLYILTWTMYNVYCMYRVRVLNENMMVLHCTTPTISGSLCISSLRWKNGQVWYKIGLKTYLFDFHIVLKRWWIGARERRTIFKINLNLWITILQQILRRAPLFILLNCNETPCTFIHFHKICKVWPRTSEISKTKEFIKCRLLNQLIMECCIYLVF